MINKTVELTTGQIIKVVPVPQKMYDVIMMKHPDPPVPVIEDTSTATGEAMRFENREDPDYLQAVRETEASRQKDWAEATLLFGLQLVEMPEGWEPPFDEIHYIYPEWQSRTGEKGPKLDWIEWDLLRNTIDHTEVVAAIFELAAIPEDATDVIEASFPGNVENEE